MEDLFQHTIISKYKNNAKQNIEKKATISHTRTT